jgi:hypothetical protein
MFGIKVLVISQGETHQENGETTALWKWYSNT